MKTTHVLTEAHVCHRLDFNPNAFVLLATRDYTAKVVVLLWFALYIRLLTVAYIVQGQQVEEFVSNLREN